VRLIKGGTEVGCVLEYIPEGDMWPTREEIQENREDYIKRSFMICKAVPLQAWSGPEGSRKLMFPDFLTAAQNGVKVVSLTHRPHLPPENIPGTHFC
jgi:hypothetical protein